MFQVISQSDERQLLVARRENEAAYLFKTDEQKFPLLSQIGDFDPTDFGYEEMPQLLGELEAAQDETELKAAWETEIAATKESIERLQAELKRYAHTMWSIEGQARLVEVSQYFEQMNRPGAFELFLDEARSHIKELQDAATLCHQKHGFLSHNPFE